MLDGNPLPHTKPRDRQQLMQAISKSNATIENAEKRAKAFQAKLNEVKQNTQKYYLQVKQAQQNAAIAAEALKRRKDLAVKGADPSEGGSIATKVNDTVAALALTADKRRDQLNQKRSGSTSGSWVQTLPSIPSALRKSLWYKMHRRRQQIVLRPSPEALLQGLQRSVTKALANLETTKVISEGTKAAELQRAEQAFLLAVHPTAKEELSTLPTTSTWAEPGK